MPTSYIQPMSDQSPGAVQDAAAANAAVRRLNHGTWGTPIPAPVAYEILGDLKPTGHRLSQTLEQLADGLYASSGTHDLHEGDCDTTEAVHRAHNYLNDAAGHATLLADLLEIAQGAIGHQRDHAIEGER